MITKLRLLLPLICAVIFVINLDIYYHQSYRESIPFFQNNKTQFNLHFYDSSLEFNETYLPLLSSLGIFDYSNLVNVSEPLPNITIISAVSEDHSSETRAQLIKFAQVQPKFVVYLYDLGLSNATRRWFSKACNVRLKNVDLKKYNVHKSMKNYRFKPIVIATALKEFPAVFWMDSSTVASNRSLSDFLTKINIGEHKNVPNVYIVDKADHSTFSVTMNETYGYLSPQSSVFVEQYQSGKILFYRTKTTLHFVLKWWVLCALEENCSAPMGHRQPCKFSPDRFKKYAGCHRYDQSSLNLIAGHYNTSLLGNWASLYFWTKRGVTLPLTANPPQCSI